MTRWTWPLKDCTPLLPDAPGTFGEVRAEDVHTGVDLYCELGTEVVAVEDGEVVAIEWFTGQHVATPDGVPATWWNDTQIVLIQGASGVVGYGEIDVAVQVGDRVVAGQTIGVVNKAVLRSFKGRPMVMLHLELYSQLVRDPASPVWAPSSTVWWAKGETKPEHLLDPTPLLGEGHTRFDLSTYDGKSCIDPFAPQKPARWWAVWGGVCPE